MNNKMMKPKIDFKILARVMKYILKNYKLRLGLVIICIVLSTLATVAGSLYLEVLIDDYITPLIGVENPVFTGLLKAISVMILIYAVSVITSLLHSRIMVTISEGTLKIIRDEMFIKMQRLPIKYFDTHTHGDIMSRYTNDTDTLSQMIAQTIPQFFSSAITIITVFVSMLFTNIYLTIVVMVSLAIILGVTKFITSKSGKYFIKQQEAVGKLNGYIEEMINGQKVVKVFCYEERAKEGFDKLNDELCETVYNANKYANNIGPVNGALGNVQYALLAIVGGLLAINNVGNVSVGLIVSFLQLSKTFIRPITQVSQQLNSVIMALAGAKRIFELMDEEIEVDEGYVTLVNAKYVDGVLTETNEKTEMWAWKHLHGDGTLEYIEVKGHIELTEVDFGYEENKIVLQDISLYAKPGQKIAFVGATGAGKTTITNLINRFYDIEDGKIRYDGININKIKKDDLRRSLGMVLQDTHLFSGTIKDNIKYGNDAATDEEVIEAAKLANAHDFIMRLPKGYDTDLSGDGASLSQGQRQLLAIARCALVDPPVMILDEATSSIDTRTEKIVQDGMDKLMEGRTVLVIAHRLSTVRNSKAIIVLDHGKIIERGNHEDLIAQKGVYYQLYTGAFELE
ncbi:MAG: ABC transporter ATP-binding protein [Clostridia bacterium]|nr:ABC transporter ATP-binding protein [Clostridia bacterium]